MDLRSIPARYQTPAAALFALLLGAAWLTAWGWKQNATDGIVERELQRSIAVATSLSNILMPRYQSDLQRAAAKPHDAIQKLDFLKALGEDVTTQIRGQRVAKLRLYDSRGVAVYSTESNELGSALPGISTIERALRAEAVAELVQGTSPGVADGGRNYVHAFVPANPGILAKQDAAFEIYSDVSETVADVQQEARTVWAIANLAGLTVFGVALIILRRAEEAQRRKDAITGLPGREIALSAMSKLQKLNREKMLARFGWAIVSVQRLQQVSAAYGHHVADEVLRQAATRLESIPGVDSGLFSLGGEAFALLVTDQQMDTDEQLAERLARSVIRHFADPIEALGHSVVADLAIGIALGRNGDMDPDELMNRAEVSVAEAKRQGSGQWQLYVPGLEQGVRDRLQSMGGLREALERQQFMVYYQPLVDAQSHAWVGCEALVRWKHPVKGIVLPDYFIPLLEETGMIVEVGMFVLREACRQAVEWRKSLSPQFTVSVNLSARQFADPDLLKHVSEVLTETGLPASALTIEVTETFLALEPEYAAGVLTRLRHLGVAVAIDDFGVGYSSLSSLRQLPVDTLKIDRSFVTQAPHDPVDASIAQAIAALAKGLDLTLVAEGVETDAHAEFTRNIGCNKLQGFLFARPLDVTTFETAYRHAARPLPMAVSA